MNEKEFVEVLTLDEYFKEHPEEEDEFIDEMARLRAHDGPVEMPEEWPTHEWLEYA